MSNALLLTAGALFVLGSILPWLKAVTIFGSFERGALDGDGLVTLGAGVALLGCGLAGLLRAGARTRVVIGLLAALVGAGVVGYDGTTAIRLLSQINDGSTGVAHAELGAGLVVLLIAVLCAAAGLATAGVGAVRQRTKLSASHPSNSMVLPWAAVGLIALVLGGSGAAAGSQKVDLSGEASASDSTARDTASVGTLSPDTASSTSAPDDAFATATDPAYSADQSVAGNAETIPGTDSDNGNVLAPVPAADAPIAPDPAAAQPVILGDAGSSAGAADPNGAPPPSFAPAAPRPGPVASASAAPPVVAEPLGITADPTSGPNGTPILVTGTGWTPGSYVSLEYYDPTTKTACEGGAAKVGDDGRFSTTIKATDPHNTLGRHILYVGGSQRLQTDFNSTG